MLSMTRHRAATVALLGLHRAYIMDYLYWKKMHEVKLLSPHFWTAQKNEFASTIYCTPKPAENQITNSVLAPLNAYVQRAG